MLSNFDLTISRANFYRISMILDNYQEQRTEFQKCPTPNLQPLLFYLKRPVSWELYKDQMNTMPIRVSSRTM